jgi:hypothetical protein
MGYPRSKPTLEEFNKLSYNAQLRWRTKFPGEYPDHDRKRGREGKVPTLEEYNSYGTNYQCALRKKHPGVYPSVRSWGKNKEIIEK